MTETFAEYRARVLGYLGTRDPVRVQRALRTANLRLLAGVPRPWWDACAGVHEVRGRQTVAEFVALEAAHDLNHLRQIDRILAQASGGRAAARRRAT